MYITNKGHRESFASISRAYHHPHEIPLTLSTLVLIMAVFSVFSTVAFLFSSHGKARKWAKAGKNSSKKKNLSHPSSPAQPAAKERLVLKTRSSLSSKALLKMISWRKVHEEQVQYNSCCSDSGGDDDDEEALWRKTIMRGEKCRPWDFSGKIVYDSHGNLLPS